jgi:threonine dehydrogenase-like Zn-dependent dehydrogenase
VLRLQLQRDRKRHARHAFDIALDLLKEGKVRVEDMLTHTFPIEDYRALIAVHMAKSRHRAIKTAVRF